MGCQLQSVKVSNLLAANLGHQREPGDLGIGKPHRPLGQLLMKLLGAPGTMSQGGDTVCLNKASTWLPVRVQTSSLGMREKALGPERPGILDRSCCLCGGEWRLHRGEGCSTCSLGTYGHHQW